LSSFRREWKEELNLQNTTTGRQSPKVSTEVTANVKSNIPQARVPAKANQSRPTYMYSTQPASTVKESDNASAWECPQHEVEEDRIDIKEKVRNPSSFFNKINEDLLKI
jgi:hypothetical protein